MNYCFNRLIKNLINTRLKSLSIQNRCYTSSKLSQILTEAEKQIRVPLSHFNIKHLLKDELDITIFTLNEVNTRAIADTNHPIVEIARTVFGSDETDSTQTDLNSNTGSLLLLLIAKLSESLPSFKTNEIIIDKQYYFAEIYEMINKALVIHDETVVNVQLKPEFKSVNYANKLAILGGNYLLSFAIVRLSTLIRDNAVLRLVMCAIEEYCLYHFNGLRDPDGQLMPTNSMNILDWEELSGHSLTKLLSYGCQIMTLLAHRSDRYQKAAFDFGYNLQLIWNLKQELQEFKDPNTSTPFNLISAPVIFHIESDHKFVNYVKVFSSTKNLDFSKMRQTIISGPAIDLCHKQLRLYTNKANKCLDIFPESIVKNILKEIIIA